MGSGDVIICVCLLGPPSACFERESLEAKQKPEAMLGFQEFEPNGLDFLSLGWTMDTTGFLEGTPIQRQTLDHGSRKPTDANGSQ